MYAETFKVEPHLARPPAQWYLRWQTLEQARASRQVYQESKRVQNWAEKMTPEQKTLMLWATNDND